MLCTNHEVGSMDYNYVAPHMLWLLGKDLWKMLKFHLRNNESYRELKKQRLKHNFSYGNDSIV